MGYRAAVEGKNLVLQLGYSHPVCYPIPADIDIKMEGQVVVVVSGISRQRVGQIAAEIREKRPPEPYKGKGVRYIFPVEEEIIIKEGKKK